MSNRKFNRQFILRVESNEGEYHEIISPLTCEFNITRHNQASTNVANFVLYNLSSEIRNSIYKYSGDVWTIRQIEFYAGYEQMNGGQLPRCFKGQVLNCFSVRQGSDYRTEIEAFEMFPELIYDQISETIYKNTPTSLAIKRIASSVKGLGAVTISKTYSELTKRTVSVMGCPYEILVAISKGNSYTNSNFYTDSNNAYFILPTELVNNEDLVSIVASNNNGLLGTPRYFNEMMEIDMLFEPRIIPSQLISIKAIDDTMFNGDYKLVGFIHSGIISGAVSGDCKTVMTLVNIKPSDILIDMATTEYRYL